MSFFGIWSRPLFIFGLIIVLLMPQTSILNLIRERSEWHQSAIESIRQSWPGEQYLAGPFLRVDYRVVHPDNNDQDKSVSTLLMPETLNINAQLDSRERYKGIHKIPVYHGNIQVEGAFDPELLDELIGEQPDAEFELLQAQLEFYISDQRGIVSQPTLEWAGGNIPFVSGDDQQGIQAFISKLDILQPSLPFRFDLQLNGMQSLHFAQIASHSNVRLSSNWQHPGFSGDFLPLKREINDEGFQAEWTSNSLSNQAKTLLEQYADGEIKQLLRSTTGVNLVQPVDHYALSERSVKHAQLFIMLTFAAMILFELLKQLRIHPIQYLLIGLELTLFYLLLVSLSEHLRFGLAYFIATLASTSLLTVYFVSILKNRSSGLLFGSGLLLLYSILYIILQAETHALLMGSLFLFLVLSLLMISTRHLDWYELTESWLPGKREPQESS